MCGPSISPHRSEYVGSGAYRKEPEFQRFLQNKAELMKDQGEKLELWR
jgi:hypothetical protein